MKKLFLLLPMILTLLACGPVVVQTQPTQDVSAIVNATLTAVAQNNQPAAMPVTSVPQGVEFGSIAGSLTFPSETLPVLRVVATKTDYSQTYYVDTLANQNTYQIDNLPAGSYTVVAYTFLADGKPSNTGGAYTQAVACGLSTNCTDHTLIPVTVTAGQIARGIDPGDWWTPQGALPQNLGADPFPYGTINGTLTFPAASLPAMRIAFYNQTDKNASNFVETGPGQSSFFINLPEGTYTIVAYSLGGNGFTYGVAGGYTNAVLCGLTADCTDHTLIPVTLKAGDTITVNPGDWYAPEGTFPPMPVQ